MATALALSSASASAQTFSPTGSMAERRHSHTATPLTNGLVLIAGGFRATNNLKESLRGAELFDPATGTFRPTGNLNTSRYGATATLLSNGKVLIAGGYSFDGDVWLASAELYDPSTETFTFTGNMRRSLFGHTATLLSNGTVLIAGGFTVPYSVLSDLEIYIPATGTFSFLEVSLSAGHAGHTATLLPNGQVLFAGGYDTTGLPATAELFDPGAETFPNTGSLNTARSEHSATLLNDGRVLIAGGYDAVGNTLASAELYDPITRTFRPAENMIDSRAEHTSTLLSDGTVLLAGGRVQSVPGGFGVNATAEIYNPATGEFARTGSLNEARHDMTATLLTTGQVLVAGGVSLSAFLSSAEVFQPPSNPFALLSGNNTFTGNQNVTGTVTATNFVGNGAGLTGVVAASAATAGFASTAAFATNAGSALALGGVAANHYARLDIPNAFTGNQTVVGNVTTSGNVVASGTATIAGTLTIGAGTPIVEHLSKSFTITVGSITSGSCTAPITAALAGASDGDTIALGVPNAMTSSGALTYFGWVIAADKVAVRVCNPRGPATPALTGSLRVDLWKH